MASNISVAITVDNKQYIANIKAADSATQKFATSAVNNLDKISLGTNNLLTRLGGLKAAFAGLISATAVQQANNFANAIKDISTTTDVSIENVLSLSRAFELNGGTAEGAQNSILKFADSIAQARSGNDSALKSFREIGISIDDLNKNGIEELTKRSIAGIAGLSSATAQIRTQTDLFGKTARGVSFGGVQQTQRQQIITPETVAALKAGADASENLKRQFGNLTEALLLVAKPLNDIVKDINITATAFASLIKAITAAVAVFALFKGISVINGLLAGLGTVAAATGGVVAWFGLQFAIVANSLKYFVLNLGRAIGLLPTAFGGLTSVGFALGALAKGFLRFAGVAGIIYTVVEAIDFLSKTILNFSPIDFLIDKFDRLLKVAREYLGLKPSADSTQGAGAGRGGNTETLKQQQEQGEKMKKAWDEQQDAIKATQERYAKLNAEIRKTGDNLQYQNSQKLKDYEIEKFLVGKSEDQVELFKAMDAAAKEADDAIKGLTQRRMEWSQGTEDQRANLGLIDEEIARIRKLSTAYIEKLPEYIGQLQGARLIERARLQDIENLTKAMEKQAQVQEALSSARLSIISQGQDTAFAGSKIGKSALQQQMMDIAETNRRAGLEASRAFAAAFEDGGDGLNPEQARQLADGLKAIEDGYAGITAAQLKNLETSRTWETGWAEAFANYKDNANNAAEQSKTYFDTFTRGAEDAFVRFVQTGKLSFKDLANSLIAEFARIQAKKALAGLFDMGGGGSGGGFFGNIFGSIGKIFGFASGGNPAMGKPIVVGEQGPELFIPRNAGTVVPNNQLGGSVNNTTVNYNIQAVDASSFKSMVARDPQFLYAVTEQGRRSLPGRR